MKNNLLLHTMLLGSILVHTACVQKNLSNENPTSAYETESQPNTHIPQTDYEEDTPTSESTEGLYQLQSIQGQRISIGERNTGFVFPQYPNKIVLLQVFGKDCPYCFEEMPIINTIHNQYRESLQVIAIQAQERMDPSTASQLIGQYQMDYPIIEADEATHLLLFLNETYGWTGGLPFMQLIKNGVTEYTFPEGPSYEELQESVDSLL
ncbi:TlpA family protein disulfide reductase [bacterium]|nr:TlpA family protein disulfide reductase [bacterium]MBU1957564.1 TlpA family protein disulfide reductase [bacterium]